MAEVVNGLSLPTMVASFSVTVCVSASDGTSTTATAASTRKRVIEASAAERIDSGSRVLSHPSRPRKPSRSRVERRDASARVADEERRRVTFREYSVIYLEHA